MGAEARDEARRVDVEPPGDDLRGGAHALVGARGPRPVVAAWRAAVGGGDGAGEEEGLLEVALDGARPGVLLHALVPGPAVAEEDGDLAPFVAAARLAGGGGGGGVGVGFGGGGRHLELLGAWRRRGRRRHG